MKGVEDSEDFTLEHQSDIRDLIPKKGWSMAVCRNKLYARTLGSFDNDESLLLVSPILKRNAIVKNSHRGYAGASFGSAVTVNDCYVVFFGGKTPADSVCDSCDVFNVEQDRLIGVPRRGPWPCARQRHATLAAHDQMFVYGGIDNDGRILSDLWSFCVETFSWRKIECSEGPEVFGMSLCLVNQRMLLLGGHEKLEDDGKNVSKSLYVLPFHGAFEKKNIKKAETEGGVANADKLAWKKCDGLPEAWKLETWVGMSFVGTENIVLGYGRTVQDPCAIILSFSEEDWTCSVLSCAWKNRILAFVKMTLVATDSFILVPIDGTLNARLFLGRINRSSILFHNSKSMAPSCVQAFKNLDSIQRLPNNVQNYLEQRTDQSRTMLLEAASFKSDFQVMSLLVAKMASAKEIDCFGRNVLHYVCMHGREEVLLLFKNFVEELILKPDIFGRTPLHYGLKFPKILSLLLNFVQALDVETADLVVPVVVEAVRINSWHVIHKLWSAGFDLEKCDENGFCPVHVAALLGHAHCLDELLKGGCLLTRPTKETDQKEPPLNVLSCAMRTNQEVFLEHLVALLPVEFVRVFMSEKGDASNGLKKRASHHRMDHVLENISKMQRNISAHTVKNRQRVPFNVVLRGGDLRGSTLFKAYNALKKKGKVVLDHVARLAGIGCGVLVAFALSVGMQEEKFASLMKSFPLDPAQSGRKYTKDDLDKLLKLSASGFVNFLMSENSFSKALRKDPYKFLFNFEKVQVWLESFLESVGLDKNLTFSKLHDLHVSSFENKFRDLYILSFNTTKKLPEIFSWENTPEVIVADAVRVSCGLPFMFEESHVRKLQGVTATRFSEDGFSEAFFKSNSPLALFDFYEYFDFTCPGKTHTESNRSVLNPRSILIDVTEEMPDQGNDWILKSISGLVLNPHKQLGSPVQERNRVMTIYLSDQSTLEYALDKAVDEFSERFDTEKSITLSKEFLAELVRLSRVEICGPLDCISIVGVGLSDSPDMETMVSLLHAATVEDFWYLTTMLNLNIRDSSKDTLSQYLIKKRDTAGLKKLCHPSLRSHVNWKLSDGNGTTFSDLVTQHPLDSETKDMLLGVYGELFGQRDAKEMTLVRQGMAAYKASAEEHQMNMVAIDVLELRLRLSVRAKAAKSGLFLPISDPKSATDRYLNIASSVNLMFLLYPGDEKLQMDSIAHFVVANSIFGLQFSNDQLDLMFSKSETSTKALMAHILSLDEDLREGRGGNRRVWLDKTSAGSLLMTAKTFLGSRNMRTDAASVNTLMKEMN